MRCTNAERVEACIDEYNSDEQVDPENRVIDLFVPMLAMRRRTTKKTGERAADIYSDSADKDDDRKFNELRGSLRRFVFLYARPSAFEKGEGRLPSQYWNSGRGRLLHYRSGSGKEITVRNDKMTMFISGCLEYMEKFEIHAREAELTDGIQVTVRRGAFKDMEAEVYNVHYQKKGIRFSIAIKFFSNDRYIHVHDCSPEDVVPMNQYSPVFSDNFIDRIQTGVLSIMHGMSRGRQTSRSLKADREQLRQFYYMRHAIVDDELVSVQLDALMLICASLSRNGQEKTKYNKIIKQRIKSVRALDTGKSRDVALAYLLTALFVSTRDADYRTELKQLVREKLSDHKPLCEFLSLVRKY